MATTAATGIACTPCSQTAAASAVIHQGRIRAEAGGLLRDPPATPSRCAVQELAPVQRPIPVVSGRVRQHARRARTAAPYMQDSMAICVAAVDRSCSLCSSIG